MFPAKNRAVDTGLTHRAARKLFVDLADQALDMAEQRRLEAHLEACADCAAGWQRYSATVQALRGVQRERAPVSLATTVMRRVRRNRHRGLRLPHPLMLAHRVPMEAAIPLLLGVAIAAFLILAAL